MESLGFKPTGVEAEYENENYTISDLRPRNVIKTEDGDIIPIDEIIKSKTITNGQTTNQEQTAPNQPTQNISPNDETTGITTDDGGQENPQAVSPTTPKPNEPSGSGGAGATAESGVEKIADNKNNDNFVEDENAKSTNQSETQLDNRQGMGNRSERGLVEERSGSEGIYRTAEAANTAGSRTDVISSEDREELESRGINPDWDFQKFRKGLEEQAKQNNVWLDESYLSDKKLVHDHKQQGTNENDLYLNSDGKTFTKVNNLYPIRGGEHHQNISSFLDRIDAHNALFPNVRYNIKGFTNNKDGRASIVMEQPIIDFERNATKQEIEDFLKQEGFQLSGKRDWSNGHEVWSNGKFELFDARPANVLKGKDGELYFIDTIPHSVEYMNQNKQQNEIINNNSESVQQTPTFNDNEQPQTWSEEIIPTSNPALSVKKSTNPNTGASTFEFINTKSGKPVNVSDTTQKKYLTEIVKNTTYPETTIPAGAQNEDDYNQVILQDSKNPIEVANVLIAMPKYQDLRGTKEWHIANNITKVSRKSFIDFSDKNNITIGLAKAYFAKKGTETNEMKIDRIAFNASSDFAGGEYSNDEITVGDVVKFILEYRTGTESFFKQPNPDYQAAVNRFVDLTGMNPTQKVLKDILGLNTENIEVEQRAKVYAENQVAKLSAEQQNDLANEYDQWFNSLTLQEQTAELQNTYPYEDITGSEQPEVESQPKSTDSKRQSGTNATNESTAKQGEKASQKVNTTSPEYQQLLKDREAQEARVKSTKKTLDRVSKNTNKDFQADQVNLFEERQAQEGMFDERADGNAGKEIIAKAKREYDQAKADLAKTNKAIRDFESGKQSGTGSIDFSEETGNTKKDVRETRKEDFRKSRAVRDEKINAKIDNALDDLLKTMRGKLNAGIDPEVGLKGAKLAAAYIEGRVYKLADILQDVTYKLGDISEDLFDAIKGGYASYRETATDDVYTNLDTDTRNLKYEVFKKENVNLDSENKEPNNGKRKTIQSSGRTLQRNNKRLRQRERKKSLQKSDEEGNGRDGRTQGDDLSGTDGKIGKTSNGQGGVLPTDADLLTPEEKIEQINQDAEQEPALVEFNLQDNNTNFAKKRELIKGEL